MFKNAFKTFSILFYAALISSCGFGSPRTKLSEDKLKAVFLDFHTAEHMINRAPSDLKDSIRQLYENQIFEIHAVDREDFYHDLDYFEKNPRKFADFYEKLSAYSDSIRHDILDKIQKKGEISF